jgi:hypothetical protein
MRRASRAVRGRMARIGAVLALAVGGAAAIPSVPAGAATLVNATWNLGTAANPDYESVTPLCSDPGTYTYGGRAAQVYNPCSGRVWLHYYDTQNDKIIPYCVNPRGGLAYDFSYPFTDLQVTTNPNPCWASNAQFTIAWWNGGDGPPNWYTFSCNNGETFINTDGGPGRGWWVYTVQNDESNTNQGAGTCPFRIWLHATDSGTGQAACLDPGNTLPPNTFPNGGGYSKPVYWQVQETANQSPCSAGAPPFPY